MIICPNCESIGRVEIVNGEKEFLCDICLNFWFPDPEAIKIYEEYVFLKSKTHIRVADVRRNLSEPYHVNIINPTDLSRKKELAKILNKNYKSYLDVSASDWFEINRDSFF